MPTTITLTGWKEFEAKLKNMPQILEKEIGGEVRSAAEDWAGLAKQTAALVAFDTGFLAGHIDAAHPKPMYSEVVSHAEYSAPMEWGTKTRVSVPAELSAYAMTFKGKPSGQGDFKQAIFDWCERKGIEKKLWWPIFISIVTKGVHPHPFFFIQMPIVEKELFKKVDKILKTEH